MCRLHVRTATTVWNNPDSSILCIARFTYSNKTTAVSTLCAQPGIVVLYQKEPNKCPMREIRK